MAEVRDDKERLELYRKLLSDPATRNATAKLSYKQWESKLLNDDNVFQKVGEYATKKNWALDADDFLYKYTPEKAAPPTPKPQAAPKKEFMEAPSLEEEEAYVPEPQPLVGSPEYDAQLQAQYGGMAPTLGATFGGVPAAFETKAQKKQEQISPVFKAQQLAFEDVPIAEEQRRAQKQFAKATKQQQQAALRGGTGFELQQEKKKKERGYGEWGADVVGSWAEGGKRIAKNILSTVGYFAQTQAATDPMANLPYEKRQEMMQQAGQKMYDNATAAQNTFQDEIAKRNIQTSVLQAINKGEYSRLPESVLYTVGDAAMQIIPSILTMGGSTYMQTLPQVYKDGVDAIAKEKGISPEQVVASGDDAFVVSQINAGLQSALEYFGAGLISKSIASRGAYKAMRDYLLKQGVNRNLARGASLLGVGTGEALTEYGQEGVGQIGKTAAKSPTVKAFFDKLPKELFTPEAKNQRAEAFVGGLVGGLGLAGGGQVVQSAMDRTLFEAPKIGKATQRPDMDVVQTDNKIQERNKIAQAMEEAVKANPEAEGQIRQQYQKRINEAAPTDEEVLSAYDGLAVLPETEEKNTIRENLEAYMAEKGIQPEPTGIEAGLGEGLRVTSPVIQTVNADFPPPQPPISEEEVAIEETPAEEEELSLEDQLMGLVPQEETAPAPAEEVAPAEEEVATEEIAEEPTPLKAGDFVIVNGEKGVVVVTPGGQISVETDTKIYDLDERGIAAIGGKLVTPKEQTQTEYEVEVIDDDNAVVNGEPFKIIRDEKGNTIALQGETRTIRTEPVMVDVDIKRNKAQVTETLQEQAEEVESLSPDMTLDKQRFVDDIIGQNMTEGVDRILSEGVTEKTAEKDLLQFKLFVEATIADLRARQKGNPYAEAMIEQLQEALNTVYYEYYSQGRKAETRAAKTQKKTDRGTKGKERVSPKPAEGKQPAAPVTPAPAAPKKEEVQQEPRAAQKIAAISPTNLQVFKGVVTKDPLRPKMQGVYFDKANQKIVATDGMNMVVISRDVKSDVVIDPKTGQVIKEAFPDYQTVIPTDYTKGVRNVNINDLLGKLDAIIKGDKERAEKAFATITFNGEQVGITPKVLKAGLKALKDLGYETASIEYENPNKPLLIKTKDGKTILLTMPTFLREDKAEEAISIGEFALEDIGKPKAEPAPATETKEGKKAEAKEEKGAAPEFTSEQSSEAATAFDKAKTSKGFDKKHGKGAYKTLSDITKNFEDIMDKVSEKIKQDCIV